MEEIEVAYNRWEKEKREDARVSLKLELRWEGRAGSNLASTADIGRGGCFITSTQLVPVGDRLMFEVKTPTGRWMRLFGEVIYHLPDAGFGVRFKLLTAVDRETLELLLDYAKGMTPVD
jgi:hypothetical protein